MAGLGRPKTGGRARGTPNRSTQAVVDRMEELRRRGLRCDVIQILAEIACGQRLEPDGTVVPIEPPVESRDRLKAAAELASFIYPKRKAIELTDNSERPIQFVIASDSNLTTAGSK